MLRIGSAIKKSLVGGMIALLMMFYPLSTFTFVSTSASTTGETQPTGADASTYTYNEATGLWENEHYTWDPVTKKTSPKTPQDYSYNPETGMWDTTEYVYDAPSQKYVPNTASTSQPPAGAAKTSNGSPSQPNDEIGSSTTTSGAFDGFFDASISNTLNSTAQTGDAGVLYNTLAGNATTGNALVISNLINLLQSAGFDTSNLVNFESSIQGDVVGDLLIDPGELQGVGTANSGTNNLAVNSQQTGNIQNNINLSAGSGDATVSTNTTAGDATSGNADAVANIVNMINSVIGSGQSFIGNVNIMGNFNGDILLPPDFLNTLLSSNNSLSTTTAIASDTNVLVDITNNSSINNNVQANASTGNATVGNNTTAGDATTGNAASNITLLNLTGSQVIGKNALLVFVNVLGQWVGMIMNAPGATSAVVGGDVNQTTAIAGEDVAIASVNNSSIDNNIVVTAQSGDASVVNNTEAGDATSGDATASANIANIINSSFSLSDWFGVLFINVFGSWIGSFGVDTAAGNSPTNPGSDTGNPNSSGGGQVFQFIPASQVGSSGAGGGGSRSNFRAVPAQAAESTSTNDPAGVVAAAIDSGPDNSLPATSLTAPISLFARIIAGLLLGTLLLGIERAFMALRQREVT